MRLLTFNLSSLAKTNWMESWSPSVYVYCHLLCFFCLAHTLLCTALHSVLVWSCLVLISLSVLIQDWTKLLTTSLHCTDPDQSICNVWFVVLGKLLRTMNVRSYFIILIIELRIVYLTLNFGIILSDFYFITYKMSINEKRYLKQLVWKGVLNWLMGFVL